MAELESVVTGVLVFDGTPTSHAVAGSGVTGVIVFDDRPLVRAIYGKNFPGTAVVATTGRPGADGASAYEIAVEQGFSGSVDQWLLSLRGVLVLDPNEALPDGLPVGTVVYRRIS